MSDPVPPADPHPPEAAAPAASASAAGGASAPPGRARRWLRRARRIAAFAALGVVLLLVAVRIALPYALPVVLEKVGAKLDLAIRYRALHLSLVTGDVELDGLVVEPIEGGEPFLALGHLRADVALARLLRGEVVVRRVDVDGLHARIERDAEGRLVLLERVQAALARAPEEPEPPAAEEPAPEPEAEAPEEPAPLVLASPVIVEAVRVQRLTVRLIDHAPAAPLDETFTLDVRLHDLGRADAPGRVELLLTGGALLDALRVEGVIGAYGAVVDARLAVALRGLHLRPLGGLLAPLGIRPIAREHEADLALRVALVRTAKGPRALAGSVALEGIHLTADGEEQAALDRVFVDLRDLGPALIRVEAIEVEGVRGGARRLASGALRAAGIEVGGPPMAGPGGEAGAAAGTTTAAATSGGGSTAPATAARPPAAAPRAAASPAPSAPPPAPPIFELGRLRVAGVAARFLDEAVHPAADLAVEVAALTIEDLVIDPARPDAAARLAGRIALPGIAREGLALSGTVVPDPKDLRADLAVELAGLAPDALAGYLAADLREVVTRIGRVRVGVDARVLAAAPGTTDLTAEVELAVGGVVEALAVRATTRLAPDGASAKLAVDGRGLRYEALAPLLRPAGLVPVLRDGRLRAAVEARVGFVDGGGLDARVRVGEVALTDGGATLAGLERLELSRVEVRTIDGPAGSRTRIDLGAIEVAGVGARAWFGQGPEAGALLAAGLRVGGGATAAAPPAAETLREPLADPTARPLAAALVTPADGAMPSDWVELPLRVGLRVEPFALELGPGASPAKLSMAAKVELPGAVEAVDLAADATLRLAAPVTEAALDARLAVSGITLGRLAPFLRPAGIEPALAAGAFRARLAAEARVEPGETRARAAIAEVVYEDGGVELLGLDALTVDGVVVRPSGLEVASVRVDRPRVAARREPSGALVAGGVRVGGPAPAAAQRGAGGAGGAEDAERAYGERGAPDAAPHGPLEREPAAAAAGEAARPTAGSTVTGPAAGTAGSGSGADSARATASSAPGPVAAPAKPAFAIALAALRVTGVEATFTDEATPSGERAVIEAGVDLALTDLAIDPSAPARPAALDLAVRVAGALEELRVTGTLIPDPADARASLAIAARGLRVGPLAAFLPPGLGVTLADGRFAARLDAGFANPPGGPPAARLALTEVGFRDGEGGEPLFAMAAVRLAAPSLDPIRGIDIAEVAVEGVELYAERAEDGALHALGVRVAPPAPPAPPASAPAEPPAVDPSGAPPPAAPPAAPPSAAAPTEPSPGAGSPAAGPASAPSAPPAPPPALPKVRLGALRLELARLSFTDRQRGAAPVVVRGLTVTTTAPAVFFDPERETPDALRLEVRGAVEPVLGGIAIDITADPFAERPRVEVGFALSGIRGEGLTAIAPELAAQIDGSGLEDGRFGFHLDLEARIARRGPVTFVPERGIGLELAVRDLAFREGADGPPLLGLDRFELELDRFDPTTGAAQVKAIEMATPHLHLRRTREALELLGLRVLLPQPAPAEPPAGEAGGASEAAATAAADTPPPGEPASGATTSTASTAPAAPAPSAPPAGAPAAPPLPEVSLARFALDGLDVRVVDESFDPPVEVALDALEVELTGVSTKALVEDRRIQLKVRLGGGPVPLAKREVDRGLVVGAVGGIFGAAGGMLGGVADVVTGTEESPEAAAAKQAAEIERRPLLDEVTLAVDLGLYPRPNGTIRLRVASVELPAFRGAARAGGVDLKDGLAFVEVDLRLGADGAIEMESRATLTDLDATEPDGGPIQRALGLSAPLNAVIFLIRDDEGSIALPVNVDLEGGRPPAEQLGELASAGLAALGKVIGTAVASSPLRAAGTVLDIGKAGLEVIPGGQMLTGLFGDDEVEPVVVAFATGDSRLAPADVERLAELAEQVGDDDELVIEIEPVAGTKDAERIALRSRPSDRHLAELVAGLVARRERLALRRDDLARHAEALVLAGDRQSQAAADALLALQAHEREQGELESALDAAIRLRAEPPERSAARRLKRALTELADARAEAIHAALSPADAPLADERLRVVRPKGGAVVEGDGQVVVRAKRVRSK